jgi:hypothetical protein
LEQLVVHLPVAALQSGRFRSQGGIIGDLMLWKRKIAKDQPHAWVILFYQLIEERSEILARRALEIAEFFQGDRSVRIATNMIRRDIRAMRLLCLAEKRAARERSQCEHTNNDQCEIVFHNKKEMSAESFSP